MITQDIFSDENAYVKRSNQVSATTGAWLNEKISEILTHRGLEHPFLNQYAKLGLPESKSRLLYLETLHYFKHLPFYVCAISTLTRDENILRAICFNARDELGENRSHADLYLDFLFKKGISPDVVSAYQCLPSTKALNDGICALYSTPPLQKALGALFADETMSAAMVAKYNAGLIKEGLNEADRRFWTLHMEVEVGHSNAIFNIIQPHLQTPEELNDFSEGIDQYMHLMEMFWNGVDTFINKIRN